MYYKLEYTKFSNFSNPQVLNNVNFPVDFHRGDDFCKVLIECSHLNISSSVKPTCVLVYLKNIIPSNVIRPEGTGVNSSSLLGVLSLTEKNYYHYSHSFSINDIYLYYSKMLFSTNQLELEFINGDTNAVIPSNEIEAINIQIGFLA